MYPIDTGRTQQIYLQNRSWRWDSKEDVRTHMEQPPGKRWSSFSEWDLFSGSSSSVLENYLILGNLMVSGIVFFKLLLRAWMPRAGGEAHLPCKGQWRWWTHWRGMIQTSKVQIVQRELNQFRKERYTRGQNVTVEVTKLSPLAQTPSTTSIPPGVAPLLQHPLLVWRADKLLG